MFLYPAGMKHSTTGEVPLQAGGLPRVALLPPAWLSYDASTKYRQKEQNALPPVTFFKEQVKKL